VDRGRLFPEGPLGMHDARPSGWKDYAIDQPGSITGDVA
jgi:hypothetical protein